MQVRLELRYAMPDPRLPRTTDFLPPNLVSVTTDAAEGKRRADLAEMPLPGRLSSPFPIRRSGHGCRTATSNVGRACVPAGDRAGAERTRSPEASENGIPLSCTFVPGAWLATRMSAVADIWTTGRGPSGRASLHARQARTSVSRELSVFIRYRWVWLVHMKITGRRCAMGERK